MPAACNGDLGALAFLATPFKMMIRFMDIPSSVHHLKWWKHCNSKAIYLPSPSTGTGYLLNVQAVWNDVQPSTNWCNDARQRRWQFNCGFQSFPGDDGGQKAVEKEWAHHPGHHHHNHITITIITTITTHKYSQTLVFHSEGAPLARNWFLPHPQAPCTCAVSVNRRIL